MITEKPNPSGYLAEFFQKSMANKETRLLCKGIHKLIEAELKKKGTRTNPDAKERKLTKKYIIDNPDITSRVFGFKCGDFTDFGSANSCDISGVEYVDSDLCKKYNLRYDQPDIGNIEVKLMYRYKTLRPSQCEGIEKGRIHCIISLAGTWIDFVENSKCPVLGFCKITRDEADKIKIDNGFIRNNYEKNIILDMYNYIIVSNPLRHKTTANRNRLMATLYGIVRPDTNRNYTKVIFSLSKDIYYRNPMRGETIKEYRKRFIRAVEEKMDQVSFIEDIDGEYLYNYGFNKKDAHVKPRKGKYSRLIENSLFDDLHPSKRLFNVKVENGFPVIYMAEWLVEEFEISKKVCSDLDINCLSHVYRNYRFKLESSINAPLQLRRYIDNNPNPNVPCEMGDREKRSKTARRMNAIGRKKRKNDNLKT